MFFLLYFGSAGWFKKKKKEIENCVTRRFFSICEQTGAIYRHTTHRCGVDVCVYVCVCVSVCARDAFLGETENENETERHLERHMHHIGKKGSIHNEQKQPRKDRCDRRLHHTHVPFCQWGDIVVEANAEDEQERATSAKRAATMTRNASRCNEMFS